ncbi:MAG: hypothetical protein U0175_11905 [Caldilineaceae bacterium]
MLQRPTQTAAFWRDQFEVTSEDLDFLHSLLLDAQGPRSLTDLATQLVSEYLRRENAKIENELSKGAVYSPKERYKVGQMIVFPTQDFKVGEVVSIRPGKNPEHGDFEVVAVKFDGNRQTEYASGLSTPHRLSQMTGNGAIKSGDLLSAEEIYKLYHNEIDQSILYSLEEGERSKEFVQVENNWLLADMLATVHVGHLNIAEAMIEVQGQPVATKQLLTEVDLDKNVPPAMRSMSLDHAMARDSRFERVNRNGQASWYLRRMLPPEVVTPPMLLRYLPQRYNRALLSVELLQYEWELDDEWGESGLTTEVPSVVPSTSLTLIYPHRRYGTLPLNGRSRSFFPIGVAGYSQVTLVDGQWGNRFTGWVSHQGRYVAGLAKWMEDHQLPVGAIITLERTRNANEIVVDFRQRRPRREWARFANADIENNRLVFEMNKIQVGCEYDEQMIVSEVTREPLDALRKQLLESNIPLATIVEQVMLELARLSSNGAVHAKSVYSAVNMVRRATPGLVFYTMISNRRIREVSNGEFAIS